MFSPSHQPDVSPIGGNEEMGYKGIHIAELGDVRMDVLFLV